MEQHGHFQWPKGGFPDYVKEFMHWLCTPQWERADDEKSQTKWAEKHGFNRLTVTAWKRDERFQRELAKVAAQYNLEPERVQNVINALYEKATKSGDVQAMKLYLEHANKLQPQRVVIEDHRVSDMTDEDLAREMADLLGTDGD
jgi:hypothetical protein